MEQIMRVTGDSMGLFRGRGEAFGPRYLAYPLERRTLLHVLADRAADRTDHPWVVFDSTEQMTYSDVFSASCQVAGAVEATAGAGSHVGLLLRNESSFLPALYGTMLAGGIAVPMNPEARGPLLEHVISDSDATALVVAIDMLERLRELNGLHKVGLIVVVGAGSDTRIDTVAVHGVQVVRWEDWLDGQSSEHRTITAGWNEPCLLMYTSGTTGRAKGAIYSHHFLYLYSAAPADSLERSADDVLSTPMPLCHSAALHLIVNSVLHVGGTAHLKTKFSSSRYWQQVADDGATGGIILGPMAAMVLKATEEVPDHAMKHLWCVPPIQKEEFEERFGVSIVWQGFGMTEIYSMPMHLQMIPDVPLDTLGEVAQWMDWGVVDENDVLVPPGEKGELVFRCLIPHGMADGYYNRPDATAEAFRNFMFHTGDLASYDERGLVHFHGRMQERIRHRGENVSASEVEFVVLDHPEVLEAAVYGVPSELGEQDVKLDVVGRPGLDLEQLADWLERSLPKYAVPRYLEQRAVFPKTPSERVQKHLLMQESLDRPQVRDRLAPKAVASAGAG